MPQLLKEQKTPEWFAARRGKITASVAAACLNVGPDGWLSAYNRITKKDPQEENAYMRWGSQHENHARVEYEIASGNLVTQDGFWIHQDHPWLGASPDGLIGEDGLLELKCPQKQVEAVPEHHMIQCRVQLAVTDRFWCDYVAWVPDTELIVRRIKRDLTIETDIIRRLKAFYETYVVTNTPPPRRRPCG